MGVLALHRALFNDSPVLRVCFLLPTISDVSLQVCRIRSILSMEDIFSHLGATSLRKFIRPKQVHNRHVATRVEVLYPCDHPGKTIAIVFLT